MIRRCPAPMIVLAAALGLGLGWHPTSSRADVLTSNSTTANTPTEWLEYTLTTSQTVAPAAGSPPPQGSSNAPTPQIAVLVSPVSFITTPSPSNPLVNVYSDTSGFYSQPLNAQTYLVPLVGDNPSNGSPVTQQLLGLSFYKNGLPAGTSLTFALPFDSTIVGGNPAKTIPTLTAYNPTSITSGDPSTWSAFSSIQIKYDGVVANPNGGGKATFTPEPLSLLVWSAIAVAGLCRARGRGWRSRECS